MGVSVDWSHLLLVRRRQACLAPGGGQGRALQLVRMWGLVCGHSQQFMGEQGKVGEAAWPNLGSALLAPLLYLATVGLHWQQQALFCPVRSFSWRNNYAGTTLQKELFIIKIRTTALQRFNIARTHDG